VHDGFAEERGRDREGEDVADAQARAAHQQ
jgi:hypothetical protein